MTAAKKSYQDLETELQGILDWFEGDGFDVDEAVKKYHRGLELVQELENHLKQAENSVRELKAKFAGAKTK